LISNGLPQGVRLQEFEDLGSRRVDYSDTGAGDDLVTYKRK
jgi:hypothetical protein